MRASLLAQMVKNPPAEQETWIQLLGWEDPLRKAWQPTPVFLSEFPWTKGPGCSPWGHKELDTTERLNTAQHTLFEAFIFLTVLFSLTFFSL